MFTVTPPPIIPERDPVLAPPEAPRPSRLKRALAAFGVLSAVGGAPGALADRPGAEAPVSAAQTLSEAMAARLRDCAAEATGAKRTYMARQISAHGVPAREARAWLQEQARDPAFLQGLRDAGRGAFQTCEADNLAMRQEAETQRLAASKEEGDALDARLTEQETQIAMLDRRIAAANAVFAEHGFTMREDEEGRTVLFYENRFGENLPAAFFVQHPETGAWSLDFSPLQETRAAMQAETDALEADTAERLNNTRHMQERIQEIWRNIEQGEAITTKAETRPIPMPKITASYEADGVRVEIRG